MPKMMMASNVVPKVEVANFFRGRVSCLSSLSALDNINWKLTKKQREMFECSCFGSLLRMEKLVFSSQTVHELLLREVESPNANEMWLKIGDNVTRFSIQEFCIVTGLNCSPYPSLEVAKKVNGVGLTDALFNGDRNLDNSTLEAVFIQASCNDDLTMVKLALLYFLENVLLGRAEGSPIDSDHIQLVDDLDRFNEYPWGRVCFDLTMKSLQNALKARVQMLKDGDNKKTKQNWEVYSVEGFPWAFQVWAYEAIPTLGHKCAHKCGCALPRLVNWRSKRAPNYVELQKIFWRKDLQVLAVLHPTPEEEQQCYFQNVFALGDSNKVPPTFIQDNATSVAAPASTDENAITDAVAVKNEKRNPPIDVAVVIALKKCKRNILPGCHQELSMSPSTQEQGIVLQKLTPSLPSAEALNANDSTSLPPLSSVPAVALQLPSPDSAPNSTPLEGIAQSPNPSLDEAQTFFIELSPILDGSLENLLQSSQVILESPEDIFRAKCFLTESLSMNFELLMKPDQRDHLSRALELLLKVGYFPSSMLDLVRSFQMKFFRNTSIYSDSQECVKKADKNKEDAMALRVELMKSRSHFDQLMRDIQLSDDMIEELSMKLEEQKKLKAALEEQAKDLAKASITSKDALAHCVLNYKTLEKGKQDFEKLKAEIEASWEELKKQLAQFL